MVEKADRRDQTTAPFSPATAHLSGRDEISGRRFSRPLHRLQSIRWARPHFGFSICDFGLGPTDKGVDPSSNRKSKIQNPKWRGIIHAKHPVQDVWAAGAG